MDDAKRCFLSEENITLHKRELEKVTAQLSVYEKSLSEIKGKSIREIAKMRIDSDYKQTILCKKRFIMLHKVYFDSFCEAQSVPKDIKKFYPSRESFLYTLSEYSRLCTFGFLCLYKTQREPRIVITNENDERLFDKPTLAVDISEHAYFLDYAFDKERYIISALERLKIDALF